MCPIENTTTNTEAPATSATSATSKGFTKAISRDMERNGELVAQLTRELRTMDRTGANAIQFARKSRMLADCIQALAIQTAELACADPATQTTAA